MLLMASFSKLKQLKSPADIGYMEHAGNIA